MNFPKPAPGFWRNAFFYLMAITSFAVLVWLLYNLDPPDKWCPAKSISICYAGLIENLQIRDHAIIGLEAILGIVVLGSMVVTYSLSVRGGGSVEGGFNIDVHQDKTTVQTPSGTVTVPTTASPGQSGTNQDGSGTESKP